MRPASILAMRTPSGGGGGSDPYFANVTALIPMSTDFTDLKGNTWTPSNGATVTGGQGVFDGDAWISAPSSANFGFGSGVYTIEGFFKADSLSGNDCLIDTRGGGEGIAVYATASGIGGFFGVANNVAVIGGGGVFSTSTAKHWAVVRDSDNKLYGYLDGVQTFTTPPTDSRTLASTATCFIGDNRIAPSQPIHGKMPGGMRITKGVCRYPGGTTFTPPTSPFPTS